MNAKKKSEFPGAHRLINPAKAAAAYARRTKPDFDESTEGEAMLIAERKALAAQMEKLPKEFRGTHTYRLTEKHYRLGETYEEGALVTVTDEVPGRGWVKVSVDEVLEADPPVTEPVKPAFKK